jgi:hypothetical protein
VPPIFYAFIVWLDLGLKGKRLSIAHTSSVSPSSTKDFSNRFHAALLASQTIGQRTRRMDTISKKATTNLPLNAPMSMHARIPHPLSQFTMSIVGLVIAIALFKTGRISSGVSELMELSRCCLTI